MKAIIFFTFLIFPYFFYFEPGSFSGDIPCNVTFYSQLSQDSKDIPFTYESECELTYLEVEVFNQWGEHIYRTDDLDFKWYGSRVLIDDNGNEDEVMLPEGTYYFTAKYKIGDNEELFKQGGSIQVVL